MTGHQRISQIREEWGDRPIERVSDDLGVIKTPAGDFPVRFVKWSKARANAGCECELAK